MDGSSTWKPQRMNETFVYFEDDSVVVTLQNVEGHFLVHLDVKIWSHSVIKRLRAGFEDLLAFLAEKDIDLIHAVGDDPYKVKLWNLVRPCWRVDEVSDQPGIYVGCWVTEKE